MLRRTRTKTLAIVIATLLLVGGWTQVVVPQEQKPDVRGLIQQITPANDDAQAKGVLGTILIIGPKAVDVTYDRAWVTILKDTKLWKMEKGKKVKATFTDLQEKTEVTARFVGPVAESYPVQATAGEVVILSSPKGKK